MSVTNKPTKTILGEHYPYRFVEEKDRGYIEKYNYMTKRYHIMYECDSALQLVTALEDIEYCKWLDPEGVPCYRKNRGDSVCHPSRR